MPLVNGVVVTVPDGLKMPDLSSIDFSNKTNKKSTMMATNISMICLVVIIVTLRIGVRATIIKKLFLDDILAVIAAVFTCAMASMCLASINYGMGQHVWNLPLIRILASVRKVVQFLYADHLLYACAISFTKFSIAATYFHFIPYGRTRYFIWATVVVTVAVGIASVFATIFQCKPINSAWEFMTIHGSCIDIKYVLYATTSVNILTDFALCIIPVAHIWQLKLHRRQKVILNMLLCLGSLAMIASIVRMTKMEDIGQFDVTYTTVDNLNWSVVECGMGIICVSIPPIRPLGMRLMPKWFVSMKANYTPRIDTIPIDSETGLQVISDVGTVKSEESKLSR